MADQSLNQPLNAPRQPGGMGSDAPASEGGDRQLGERYGRALASLGNPTLQQHLAVLRDVLGSDRALWPALRHLIEQPGFEAVRNDPSAAMRQVRRDAWLQDLATWCNQASLVRVEAFLDGLLQLPNSAASAAVAEDQKAAPWPPSPSPPPFPEPPVSQRHDGNPPNDSGTQEPSPPATQPASGRSSSSASGREATVRRLRAEGLKASQRGEYQRAIALFSEALQWDGDNVSLYLQRASVQAMARNFGAAIEDFNAVLKRKPGHLDALAQRGKALAALGRLEEAKQDWQEASQQGHPGARRWLAKQRQAEVRNLRDEGIAARDSDNPQQAIDQFTMALQIGGGDAELYRLRSELLASTGNLPMALEDLSAALRLEPENAELMVMKAEIHLKTGQVNQARREWVAAANRGHRGAKEWLDDAYFNRAIEAENNENYAEVIDLMTKLVLDACEDSRAYFLRAKAYYRLDKHQKAIHDFSRVLEMEPDNAQAFVQRSRAFSALNVRRQEAEADRKKARELGELELPREDVPKKSGKWALDAYCAACTVFALIALRNFWDIPTWAISSILGLSLILGRKASWMLQNFLVGTLIWHHLGSDYFKTTAAVVAYAMADWVVRVILSE